MKVSVIIPVYNASLYLERCVKSLLTQTYSDIELIFIDDKSTDDSRVVLHNVIEKRKPSCSVVVIENEQNCGCAVSRKRGMQAATGEYMIHVDCDDYVSPRFIESLLSVAQVHNSDVVMCGIGYDYGNTIIDHKVIPVSDPEHAIVATLGGVMHGSLCNKLIRSAIIKDNDIYPEPGLKIGEDKLVLLQVLQHSHRIDFIAESLYFYNKTNETSITSQSRARTVQHYIDLTERVNSLFHGNTVGIIKQGVMHHIALVLCHVLLYGSDSDVKDNKSLFQQLTLHDITSHPVAPIYYKIAGVAHKCKFHIVVIMLRALLSLAGRR